MKKRILMNLLVIALVAALITGATQAWFTDEQEFPDEVTFTAGTLTINVDEDGESFAKIDDRVFENLNPGDCAKLCWDIVNTGTKRAEIRVKINSGWEKLSDGEWVPYNPEEDGLLPGDYEGRAAFLFPKGDNWIVYEDKEDGGLWLYYVNGPLAGTYDNDGEGESVKLCLVVGFDGPNMDNRYQGKRFKISGVVQAVQTTNGAPEAEWDIQSLEAIKSGEAEQEPYEEPYFTSGRGADMPCWKDGGEEEPQEPEEPKKINNYDHDLKVDIDRKNWQSKITISGSIFNAIDEAGKNINGDKTVKITVTYGFGLSRTYERTVTFVNGISEPINITDSLMGYWGFYGGSIEIDGIEKSITNYVVTSADTEEVE